jgi:hypothetical protein
VFEYLRAGGSLPPDHYVIAIKREARDIVPQDWIGLLGAQEGVEVLGAGAKRVQIRATAKAIETVRNLFGRYCHIEKMNPHKPLSR